MADQPRSRKILYGVFITAWFLMALRLIFTFWPVGRSWGLNHGAFAGGSLYVYIALLSGSILLFVFKDKIDSLYRHVDDESAIFKYIPLLLAAIVLAFYYLFSVKTNFLGDGYLQLANLPNFNIPGKSVEVGEVAVHRLLLSAIGCYSEDCVRLTYRIISFFSGTVFLVSLLLISRKLKLGPFEKLQFVLFSLLAGFTLLFYGYVEHYSLTAAMLFLFLLSAVAGLINRRKSILPLLAFGVACYLHKISFVYLPAALTYGVLILPGVHLGKSFRKYRAYIYVLTILLFIVLYALIRQSNILSLQLIALPISKWRFTIDGYTLFSGSHLIDYANLLIFLVPNFAFLLVAVLTRSEKLKIDSQLSVFLFVASAAGLLVAFVFNPVLGMARDWDLMSVMLIGGVIVSIYLLILNLEKAKYKAVLLSAILIYNLAAFVPWLMVNNSTAGMLDYAEYIAKLDPQHGRTTMFNLLTFCNKMGLSDRAEALQPFWNNTYASVSYNLKVTQLLAEGKIPKAEFYARHAIAASPTAADGYTNLALCLLNKGQPGQALQSLKIAEALSPDNSEIEYLIGSGYGALRNYREGLKHLQKSIEYDKSNGAPYMGLGLYYFNSGRLDSALYYYTALPESTYSDDIYYCLGKTYLALHKPEAATANFEKYLAKGQNPVLIDSTKVILSRIKP